MDTRDVGDSKPGDIKTALRHSFLRLNHWLARIIADGQTTITPRFAEFINIPTRHLWGIWPSGVDVARFSTPSALRQWPGMNDPIRLVYVGIVLDKRHLVPLCQAVQLANSQGCSFELYVAGAGPDMENLVSCASSSGGAVKVLKPVPNTAVPHLLAEMHVGVTSLPDIDDIKYAASSPIKLFEYMASGLPILATRNACHTGVVGDGTYTFWVHEPTVEGILEGLKQIWRSRADLQVLGRQARAEADRWSWAAAAAKLDSALYAGLKAKSGD
jgi:glycosyltransferase involved in cell wall biosynthesis